MVTTGTRSSIEEHAEEPATAAMTRRGRWEASAIIVLVLMCVASATMPNSVVKARLLTLTGPMLYATGLDQGWGVFAPDPRTQTSMVLARIDRTDGTVWMLGPPGSGADVEFAHYRWRNLFTQASADGRERDQLALARWAAAEDRAAGNRPALVTLVRRSAQLLPPGPGPDQEPWRDIPFFTLEAGR